MIKIIQLNLFSLWLIMFLIMLFLSMNIHPIIITILMILYNLLICLNISMWKFNFIYSIMIFLIMISGLLIIFMYFSSLISNNQMNMKISIKFIFFSYFNLFTMMSFLSLNNYLYLNQFYSSNFDSNPMYMINFNNFLNILNLYNYPFNNFSLMIMFFLLFSFLTIIKINSSSHSFSMRKIK